MQTMQEQAQQAPVRPSGFSGKTGAGLNVVDHLLEGWAKGKAIQEKQFINKRENELKAHSVTASTMYDVAQRDHDLAMQLQSDPKATPEQQAAAKAKAEATYTAYSQEQQQLAEAYAKHLGIGGDEKPKGVKGKLKAGLQGAFLPQVAAMLGPKAIESMAKPRPLRDPSQQETLALEGERKRGQLTDLQIDAATMAKHDDDEFRQLSSIPPDKMTPVQRQRADMLNRVRGLPSLDQQITQDKIARETLDKLGFEKETRAVVQDALSASRQGKNLTEVQRGALKAAGLYQANDVLDYYMQDVGAGKKYKTRMDAIRKFQQDQAQFSRAPSMFHELVNAEIEIETIQNGGKITPAGRQAAIERAIKAFRPQQDQIDARNEFQRMDWINKRAKEVGQEWLKDGETAHSEKYRKDPGAFGADAMAQAAREYDAARSKPSPVSGPPGATGAVGSRPQAVATPGAPTLNFRTAADALKAYGIQ